MESEFTGRIDHFCHRPKHDCKSDVTLENQQKINKARPEKADVSRGRDANHERIELIGHSRRIAVTSVGMKATDDSV